MNLLRCDDGTSLANSEKGATEQWEAEGDLIRLEDNTGSLGFDTSRATGQQLHELGGGAPRNGFLARS